MLHAEKLHAEIAKLIAGSSRLNARTAKLTSERFGIPCTIVAGLFAAVVTVLPRLFG